MLNLQNLDFYLFIFIAAGILFLLTLSSITISLKYYKHTIKKIENFHLKEIKAVEEVRKEIANDLHDASGSLLLDFRFKIMELNELNNLLSTERIEKIQELQLKLNDFAAVLRNTIEDTYPKELLIGHWSSAIESLAYRYSNSNINIICQNDIDECIVLSKIKANHCFRTVQELITNSIKHSNPKMIILELFNNDSEIYIIIDSRDIQHLRVNSNIKNGRGTLQINERIKFLNGTVEVKDDLDQKSSIQILKFKYL